MAPPHLKPLQVDAKTGECYLRLAAPLDNIVIGPPRMSDVPTIHDILEDTEVADKLGSLPIPYLLSHAEEWQKKVCGESAQTLQQLKEGAVFVDNCPVRSIRQQLEDGSEVYLGDIGIRRLAEMERTKGGTQENKEALYAENQSRKPGDPQLIYTVGYYVNPSSHGKGIMSAALDALLTQWAVPRMGARRILGTAFVGNEGSKRVLEKNGFVLRELRRDCVEIRGEKRSLYILDWEA